MEEQNNDNVNTKDLQKSFVEKFKFFYDNSAAGIAFFTSIIGLLSAAFAFYEPVENYFEKERAKHEVEFSKEMIDKVTVVLNSDSEEVDKLILQLSAYEMEAVPFLLYKLEKTSADTKLFITMRSLQMILEKKKVNDDEFIETIIKSARFFIMPRINGTIAENNLPKSDICGNINYILFLGIIRTNNKKKVDSFYEELEEEIKKDSIRTEHEEDLLYIIEKQKKVPRRNRILHLWSQEAGY